MILAILLPIMRNVLVLQIENGDSKSKWDRQGSGEVVGMESRRQWRGAGTKSATGDPPLGKRYVNA